MNLTFMFVTNKKEEHYIWLLENNIEYKIKDVRFEGSNNDHTSFWDVTFPVIEFFNKVDYIAYKLRWS